jgi:hypothetical protein
MRGGERFQCVAVVQSTKHARRGERCRSDGAVDVGPGERVCWSHDRYGWMHFERAHIDPAVALRMRAVLGEEATP